MAYKDPIKKKANYEKHKAKQIAKAQIVRKANLKRIQDYKVAQGCADCGYNSHPAALDFDHLGEKLYAVSMMRSYSWQSIMREVAKCEVVCANCHRIRTDNRRLRR